MIKTTLLGSALAVALSAAPAMAADFQALAHLRRRTHPTHRRSVGRHGRRGRVHRVHRNGPCRSQRWVFAKPSGASAVRRSRRPPAGPRPWSHGSGGVPAAIGRPLSSGLGAPESRTDP